jgi:hypothetical protein
MPDIKSNELHDGKGNDAELHDEILDNPEAEKVLAMAAVSRAIARGMDEAVAEKLYGIPVVFNT